MSHHCEGALITCEDFRLHQRKDGRNYVADFVRSLKIDCDIITRAGGVQDLVRGNQFAEPFLRDVDVSAKLHNCGCIHLLNHEDCGAYGRFDFSSRKEELKQHEKDLLKARDILSDQFPRKKILLYFAELVDQKNGVFKIKEL